MRLRIDFKVLLFVFKALNGQAPSYIADLLTPYSTARLLRSSNLKLPQPKLKSRDDRTFAVAAPRPEVLKVGSATHCLGVHESLASKGFFI